MVAGGPSDAANDAAQTKRIATAYGKCSWRTFNFNIGGCPTIARGHLCCPRSAVHPKCPKALQWVAFSRGFGVSP